MDAEREILDLLLDDARAATEDLARQTDLSEAEVEAAIEGLEERGAVRGYRAVVDWSRVDDEHVTGVVELNVTLDRETGYDDIADRLAKFPAVNSLQLVSGEYDFLMLVEGDSMHDVSGFVSDQVAPVPEITQTVTHFVMETYKDRGIPFGNGHDDDRLSVSP
jgi:DNA-binding Lrp family transcriptional regulator